MEHKEEPLNPNDDPWAANMRLHGKTSLIGIIRSERRDYEAQISKDRVLIQALADALAEIERFNDTRGVLNPSMTMYATSDTARKALSMAKEAGYIPAEG